MAIDILFVANEENFLHALESQMEWGRAPTLSACISVTSHPILRGFDNPILTWLVCEL